MKKLLIDTYGSYCVGYVDVPRGSYGNVEYGRRDKDGILHVHGIARLANPSERRINMDDLNKWDT